MGQGKLRAVIVDDNPDHALLMQNALREELGAETTVCGSAAAALDEIGRSSPDAIVLDYRLPDSKGWEVLAAIRERADVPVVVVTCRGSERTAVGALKAGAEDYVPKEGEYLRLLPAVVLRAVESHRRRREDLGDLRRISEALAGSLELEAVVTASLDGVMELLRPDAAWLVLPEADGSLELVGARGISPEGARKPEAAFLSQGAAPVLMKEGERPGFLCAGARAAGRFGAHHLELLGTIASHTASAARNAQLFASLERAKAQWERTFDSISDPILISDPQFRIVRLNRAAAACFDVPIKEAVGRVCYELVKGSEGPCPWHDALGRGVPISSDRYLARLDRWFSFSAFPFENGEGKRVGVVHVLRDITEERVLRGQMAQAQKLAAIGELVAGVAHELNNPLTGILGFAHLLLQKGLEAAMRDDLEKIAGEARRAARIVRNLSAFSREASSSRLSRRPVDIEDLIRKTLELRGYQLNVSGIDVVLELAGDLPRTAADPDELQQVFLNIINNAEQAMAGRGSRKSLVIRTARSRSGGIRIQVRDSGAGIPEKVMDRIFEPFFTTKESGRGTGLGLSVCYGIVQAHGGSIGVANHPDGGAVFTVELPVCAAPEGEESEEEREEAAVSVPPCAILVVDDEPVVAAYVERVLAEEGHRVTVCEEGAEALAMLGKAEFDLIVCDLKLPDMSGREIYEKAVEMRAEARDRFVFLTGDTLGPETGEFLSRHRLPWLEKPVLPEELKRAIGQRLAVGAAVNG